MVFSSSLAQLKPMSALAIVTFITRQVAAILAQQHRYRVCHRTVIIYVLLPIPAVLHIPADLVRLYTGKMIQYDVSIDMYTFCLVLPPAMDR